MNDWTQLMEAHHAWAHPKDGFRLILRPGASNADLDDLAQRLGFHPPPEFRELYRCHDGAGITRHAGPEAEYWMFVPIGDIPNLVSTARDSFHETHPDLAERFFPFIDWACGDYSGYLQAPDKGIQQGIYTFEHEQYEFEAAQNPGEFMTSAFPSIAEFLNPR